MNFLTKRTLFCSFLLLTSIAILCNPVNAQKQMSPPAGLQKAVNVSSSVTTLLNLVTEMAKQTGLTIQIPSYLQNHKLTASVPNLPAADLLDTLAELNDWRWYVSEEGNVVLTTKRVNIPARPGELPRAIQSALPRDVRNFLEIEGFHLQPQNEQEKRLQERGLFEERVIQPRITARVQTAMEYEVNDLLSQIQPPPLNQQELLYKQMTTQQHKQLYFVLFFHTLNLFFNQHHRLLYGDLPAYFTDSSQAEVRVRGDLLEIGSSFKKGTMSRYSGFGAQVKGISGPPSDFKPPSTNSLPLKP